ncbi:MAG TPA: SPOR domain-containing protein [Steroidobacteraceae bacterium]|jgi:DedD protein|nr:SPOR domain-containing protein [Steroidobacteraceae bacterium]
MESRLKERLTGAAILVALIVLIVPEIFHDRRNASPPAGSNTAAPAGAKPVSSRSYTIELAPGRAATVQPPADEPRLAAGASQPAAEPQPAAGVARIPGRVAAPAASRVPAGPPAPARVSEAPAKARVATLASSHARSGGWTVQLGLFAKSANAVRLAHTAQSHGFAVEISRFGPRGLYRVAVAGIPDRAAAEQLSHRLRGAGLPAAILGPR